MRATQLPPSHTSLPSTTLSPSVADRRRGCRPPTTKHFNAKQEATHRTYHYVVPSFAFLTGGDSAGSAVVDKAVLPGGFFPVCPFIRPEFSLSAAPAPKDSQNFILNALHWLACGTIFRPFSLRAFLPHPLTRPGADEKLSQTPHICLATLTLKHRCTVEFLGRLSVGERGGRVGQSLTRGR